MTIAILIHLATSALFGFIGARLRPKQHSHTVDQKAWRAFLLWWFCMALNSALSGLSMLLMLWGVTSLPLLLALNLLGTLAAGVALWGLLSYLLYVFRGNWDHSRWVATFYILFGLYLCFTVIANKPTHATLQPWSVLINYEQPLGPLAPVGLLLLFAMPPILAGLAFFRLAFSVTDRSARYRAVLITIGILLHFGVPYIAPIILYLFGILTPQLPWWALTYRLVGIFALLLIYFAYFPPPFVRKALRVSPLYN